MITIQYKDNFIKNKKTQLVNRYKYALTFQDIYQYPNNYLNNFKVLYTENQEDITNAWHYCVLQSNLPCIHIVIITYLS